MDDIEGKLGVFTLPESTPVYSLGHPGGLVVVFDPPYFCEAGRQYVFTIRSDDPRIYEIENIDRVNDRVRLGREADRVTGGKLQ